MNTPHCLKIFSYMYYLHLRNAKVLFSKCQMPTADPITLNSVHWVGHATVIFNLDGKIILTDPVTDSFLGHFKRLVRPSCNLSSLKFDYILISHGHMDHLSYKTLRKLNKKCTVICPPQYKKSIERLGFSKVVPLSAGNTFEEDNLKFKALEAKHNGHRYLWFGNPSSNSYIVEGSKKVFFAGDTAYTENFKDLYADVALMPVGCYMPTEYQEMHCSPEDSFKMFKLSKSKLMIPIHYRTFILAQDRDTDTVRTLNSLNDGSLNIVSIGQTIKF